MQAILYKVSIYMFVQRHSSQRPDNHAVPTGQALVLEYYLYAILCYNMYEDMLKQNTFGNTKI